MRSKYIDRTPSVQNANFPILNFINSEERTSYYMGRPRKPLANQTKHLTNSEKTEKEEQERIITIGREDLDIVPSWLIDDVAKSEFNRIVLNFEDLELIGNLDYNNIGCYCNAFSLYLSITSELESADLIIQKVNGDIVQNPLVRLQQQYSDEMRKFASLCGLTIDSRLKLAVQKQTKGAVVLEDNFGGI